MQIIMDNTLGGDPWASGGYKNSFNSIIDEPRTVETALD